jgi:hypothetical protein
VEGSDYWLNFYPFAVTCEIGKKSGSKRGPSSRCARSG